MIDRSTTSNSFKRQTRKNPKKILSCAEYEAFVRYCLKLVPNLEEQRLRRSRSVPKERFRF